MIGFLRRLDFMAAATNSFSPGRNLRMRIAQEGDVDAIVRLINAAFVVERIAFDGDRIDARGVRELLKKGAFLVAEDGTGSLVRADRVDPRVGLAGCVYVEVVGERSYLGLLCVDPGRQGTGLGRRLVVVAEEYSRNAGCCAMDLRVISPRAEGLVPFYEHLGYTQTGTAPFSPDVKTKVPCHYITMAKPLT
jgi:GNAT superfamily N-acetyltransferase